MHRYLTLIAVLVCAGCTTDTPEPNDPSRSIDEMPLPTIRLQAVQMTLRWRLANAGHAFSGAGRTGSTANEMRQRLAQDEENERPTVDSVPDETVDMTMDQPQVTTLNFKAKQSAPMARQILFSSSPTISATDI